MPNWCLNTITIKGEKETLQLLKDNNFSFDFIRPQPDWANTPNEDGELPIEKKHPEWTELVFPKSQKTDDRWYEWRLENWGTKWEMDVSTVELMNDGTLVVTGDTAWSPPLEVLRYATERFPDLEINIKFEESGCDFYGGTDFSQGEGTSEFVDNLSNLADAIANDEVSNLTQDQRNFLENHFGNGEAFYYFFCDGNYDTKDRRWDEMEECFDRTNVGYEWSDEDEEWKEAA